MKWINEPMPVYGSAFLSLEEACGISCYVMTWHHDDEHDGLWCIQFEDQQSFMPDTFTLTDTIREAETKIRVKLKSMLKELDYPLPMVFKEVNP